MLFHLIPVHISLVSVAGPPSARPAECKGLTVSGAGSCTPATILGRLWLICPGGGQGTTGHPGPHGHVPGIH